MEVLIPILMIAIPVILAVISKKAQPVVKVQKVYPNIPGQSGMAAGDDDEEGGMPGDLADSGSPDRRQAGQTALKAAKAGVKPEEKAGAVRENGTDKENGFTFTDEEKRKLIIYSEILKPKFED